MKTKNLKARCRVGDMALVIASPTTPENIGRIVKVLRLATDEDCFLDPTEGVVWVVTSQGQPLICFFEDEHGNLTGRSLDMERPYQDRCLLPLSPDGLVESVEEQRSRKLAPCILKHGFLSAMGKTGLALMAMSTAERHEFIESLPDPENEDQKNVARLVRTASSEIDAHLLIERIRHRGNRLLPLRP